MGRRWKIAAMAAAALLLVLMLWNWDEIRGWETPEGVSAAKGRQIRKTIRQGLELLEQNAGETADVRESILIEAGYPTLDTDAVYPEYLAHPGNLRAFCRSESDCCGLFHALEDGGLRYIAFLREKEEVLFFTADIYREDGAFFIRETAIQPVYDMELAEWDIFYYRLYPAGDPHYIDYTQLRLTPPARELYDLTRKYILPVGYQMVNLFLVDWREGEWGALSFHDLLEGLYQMENGGALQWEGFSQKGDPVRRMVPAAMFEETILPWFDLSLEEFREICLYDGEENAYPWRPVHGNDLTSWEYPMCEPETVSVQDNGDGTQTLTVQVYSPELKTDRLFCHELTVRPLEGERFKYVSNRVTYVSDRGLPPNMPRFALDE